MCARETVYQEAGEQERVKRKKENTREVNHPLLCPRFFRYVLLLLLLDASSCTQIPNTNNRLTQREQFHDR